MSAILGVMDCLGDMCSFRICSQMCELETEQAGVECGGGGESESDFMANVSVSGQLFLASLSLPVNHTLSSARP